MYCYKCGFYVGEVVNFCARCGTSLKGLNTVKNNISDSLENHIDTQENAWDIMDLEIDEINLQTEEQINDIFNASESLIVKAVLDDSIDKVLAIKDDSISEYGLCSVYG
ncbi:hypothetical protein SAMN06296386_1128 [Lachnospiraceae bacterium]|nr:hypothetical protein SAMN06296386_1128 [Lachnospiraceae bacterium]